MILVLSPWTPETELRHRGHDPAVLQFVVPLLEAVIRRPAHALRLLGEWIIVKGRAFVVAETLTDLLSSLNGAKAPGFIFALCRLSARSWP